MRGGRAVAELVLGHIEPTGRLPLSVPRHVGQQPTYYNQVRGQHGHRYADLTQEPQFVFGEGLTYTTVEWSDLDPRGERPLARRRRVAEVTLTNTGAGRHTEPVQAYVTDVVTSVTWATKELKAFRRVDGAAGGVGHDASRGRGRGVLHLVDAAGRRVVEPGGVRAAASGRARAGRSCCGRPSRSRADTPKPGAVLVDGPGLLVFS